MCWHNGWLSHFTKQHTYTAWWLLDRVSTPTRHTHVVLGGSLTNYWVVGGRHLQTLTPWTYIAVLKTKSPESAPLLLVLTQCLSLTAQPVVHSFHVFSLTTPADVTLVIHSLPITSSACRIHCRLDCWRQMPTFCHRSWGIYSTPASTMALYHPALSLVLSSDQPRAASLIGRNAVTWLCTLSTVRRSSWHVIEYL